MAELNERLETQGAPIDVADGFIHFSTASQVEKTAELYFAGVEGLWLLAFKTESFQSPLEWEPSRGGDLFPHLYGPLRQSDVAWSVELPLAADGHVFPDDLT